MAEKDNLWPLKLLVLLLGLLLILAAGALITAVMFKPAWMSPILERKCPSKQVDLRGHGLVAGSTIEGGFVHFALSKEPGKTEIVTMDICGNMAPSSMAVTFDLPKAVPEKHAAP